MVKSVITDSKTGLKAEVVNGTEANALVVATRPLKTFSNSVQFFANPDYGIDLNQDASAGGTPEIVYQENIEWTGTNIVGASAVFDSDERVRTGTVSIEVDPFDNVGDVFQLDKGSDISLLGYVSLSLWINVDRRWTTDSVSVYGYNTGLGQTIGNKALLEDYFDPTDNDVWQQIIIPITDMDLQDKTIDAIRFEYEAAQQSDPEFYIDDIQFEELGSPIEYTIEPEKGKWYYLEEIKMFLVNNISLALVNGTVSGLGYNNLLGIAPVIGFLVQIIEKGEVTQVFQINTLQSLMQLPSVTIADVGDDGFNSWVGIRLNLPQPIILRAEDKDRIRIVVSEDLTGYEVARASAIFSVEERSLQGTEL